MKRIGKSITTQAEGILIKARHILRSLRVFMGTPVARRLVLGLFVVQAVFLVFTVHIGTPPDEENHYNFISFYANNSVAPIFNHQQPTYSLGDKTREADYLYHYLMSLVMRVLPFSYNVQLHIIRLFSVVFGLLSLVLLAKVFRRLGISAAAITVCILIVSNLPTVLMLSAAINNDSLVWLGTALGMLLLLRLWKKPTALDMLWLTNLSILGGLFKRTLLPICMSFALLGFVVLVRRFAILRSDFNRVNWKICVAIVVLFIGVGLFTERIGGNIVRYGGITPSCEQVQGVTACDPFWPNVRKRTLAELPPAPIIPLENFVPRWFQSSFDNISDIQTQFWLHEVKPARWLTPLLEMLLVSGLLYGAAYEAKRYTNDQKSRWRVVIFLIAAADVLVQLVVNYGIYKNSNVFGLALNGRYILPSVLVLSGLACFYWTRILERRTSLLAVLAIIVILSTIFGSGLLMMLHNPQLRLG